MGDFWWYSLVLFCACRVADALNMFVGVWLVPKYVGPGELGAVAPIANFAAFLAIPAVAFANAFRNEVTRLSIARDFGSLKSLLRGVFAVAAVLLVAAIAAARLAMPLFMERIRIEEGSLGTVIVASSFLVAVSPVYVNAMQSLKKFRQNALMNVISAPVRLLVMLVAMPFRALTGYFTGQAAVPAFNILASVFCLKGELSVPARKYWTRRVFARFASLFAAFLAIGLSAGCAALVESTILRQRLPDADSAGYYMASRFSEISLYLYGALAFTLFPLAAESNPRERRNMMFKAMGANFAFCAALAAFFRFAGGPILELLPHGAIYAGYADAIPWMIGIASLAAVQGFYTTSEISAGRFGFAMWTVPLELAYAALMLLVTGHGYFAGILPAGVSAFLEEHNIKSLDSMLCWMGAANGAKAALCVFLAWKDARRRA